MDMALTAASTCKNFFTNPSPGKLSATISGSSLDSSSRQSASSLNKLRSQKSADLEHAASNSSKTPNPTSTKNTEGKERKKEENSGNFERPRHSVPIPINNPMPDPKGAPYYKEFDHFKHTNINGYSNHDTDKFEKEAKPSRNSTASLLDSKNISKTFSRNSANLSYKNGTPEYLNPRHTFTNFSFKKTYHNVQSTTNNAGSGSGGGNGSGVNLNPNLGSSSSSHALPSSASATNAVVRSTTARIGEEKNDNIENLYAKYDFQKYSMERNEKERSNKETKYKYSPYQKYKSYNFNK